MRIIKNLGFVLLFVLFFFTVPFSDTPSLSDDPDSYLSSALTLCSKAHANDLPDKCKLFGKIQIVDNFPDVKVKIVNSFPDIKVKKVKNFADKPGLWQIVDNFPDYKVQIVDHFPDYKIEYVKHFPGCD